MPRKAKGKPEEHGIYPRGEVYWLRYNWGGKQVFVNLHVRTKVEAIEEARKHRGLPPVAETVEGWERAIARYVAEKQSPVPPANWSGQRWVSMKPATAKKTISVLRVFARWSETKSPVDVTMKHLNDYLALRIQGGDTPHVQRKGAKLRGNHAGARSTLSAICSFLRHTRCMPPGKLILPKRAVLERRTLVFPRERIAKWIDNAEEDNIKLALILGFRCGLRENEIMHARPEWLLQDRDVFKVPNLDEVSGFSSKDGSYREVPPFSEDVAFLRKMAKQRRGGFLLQKVNRLGRPSKSGVYHFEKPLRAYLQTQGVFTFTIHSMRHSFATNMFAAGVSLEVLAQWLGDEPETVRRSYIHSTAQTGQADAAHRGETREAKLLAELAELRKLVQAGQFGEARRVANSPIFEQFETENAPVPQEQERSLDVY